MKVAYIVVLALTVVQYINGQFEPKGNSPAYGAELYQFEFKWLSEHAIEGKHSDFQITMIYSTDSSDPLTEIIVVVLADLHVEIIWGNILKIGEANSEIEKFIEFLPYMKPIHADTVYVFDLQYTPSKLFPANREFFQYVGSGTIPQCREPTDTRVYKHPITISQEQLNKFKNLMEKSSRELQPRNGREIYHVQP
ncbi:hypothetical protein HELRODRAFT_173706 [Helobdella robusta]|uniref:carbonic anhydrase n=1 Tax=Helobdella robusta TaxID=6412 RepID=T1F752_HELRO|nr:hypothetical protein HELRODRAFT_173706 [Helobdella robusta]ESO03409.1 hypothetical protein HELRODRAFT_173706 [Helobdella robusta]